MPRIALYAHDTYGLGHLQRCLKLARHFASTLPGIEGLILSGSPWQRLFTPPAGFRVASLPPVIKTGPRRYRPREERQDLPAVLEARRSVLGRELSAFRPDLFLVDNVPCGLHGEVLPVLRRLARSRCRSVLVLRDVLDRPDSVRAEWERAGAGEALEELFDEIWIFGEPEDAAALAGDGLLGNSLGKVRVCGRLASGAASAAVAEPLPEGHRRVLVTGGGGGDASTLIETYLEALTVFRPRAASRVVLGPDYPRPAAVASREGLAVARFVPELQQTMGQADVVVAMAGYNTVCEILESGRPAVLVPRRYPREEQWLRALRWQRSGRIELIDPADLSAESLWAAVEAALDSRGFAPEQPTGGWRATRRAAALLGLPFSEVAG